MNWLDDIYDRRFAVFVVSLAAVIFGNLIMPEAIFKSVFAPVFLVINILSGILLVYKNKRARIFYLFILCFLVLSFLINAFVDDDWIGTTHIRFILIFLFYTLVTKEIIVQVWSAEKVNETVILGLISGYICLGLLGYFMFMSIEIIEPGSFDGIANGIVQTELLQQDLLYFSYITLLTIGYGEITPVSGLARDASMLIGLLGQFYMVIITAIVVGKFLNQKPSDKD